jgi:signal transduction histidine kinase
LASIKKWGKGPGDENVLARIKRNLKRLQEIQVEVEDIIKRNDVREPPPFLPYLERVRDLVELMAEESPDIEEALCSIRPKFQDFFAENPSRLIPLSLAHHVRRVVALTEQRSTHRNVCILTDVTEDHVIRIDPDALEKVLTGLVKNAIENTPDGGEILISLRRLPGSIQLEVTDTGIGITPESQKQIFGGFYHAKETDLYSTRKPFDFGAGGKGLDLLRCRVFGEIYHFKVQCVSRRCSHIPDENDICPGEIPKCHYVGSKEECALSGGTKLKLVFTD